MQHTNTAVHGGLLTCHQKIEGHSNPEKIHCRSPVVLVTVGRSHQLSAAPARSKKRFNACGMQTQQSMEMSSFAPGRCGWLE